jgi:hypothetical protein
MLRALVILGAAALAVLLRLPSRVASFVVG